MEWLTIRGLSDKVKKTMQKAIKRKVVRYHDLDHLAGTWSKEEADEFRRNTRTFEKIEEELWK